MYIYCIDNITCLKPPDVVPDDTGMVQDGVVVWGKSVQYTVNSRQ